MSQTWDERPTVVGSERLVRETVQHIRSAGAKYEEAFERAAAELGLTPRRVRALYRGEVFSVLADEYLRIRDKFREHLAREEKRLEAKQQALRARRLALGSDEA